jgi:hypothetical protein
MRSQAPPAPSIHLGDDPDPTQELGQRMAGAAQTAQGLLTNYLFYGQRRRAEARDHDDAATAAASDTGRGDSTGERRSDWPIALAGIPAAGRDPAGRRGAVRRDELDSTGTVLRFGLRARRGSSANGGGGASIADPLAVDALAAVPPDDPLTLAQGGASELPVPTR